MERQTFVGPKSVDHVSSEQSEYFAPNQHRICNLTRLSERFRAASSEYVADMVLNHEEDGTSLLFWLWKMSSCSFGLVEIKVTIWRTWSMLSRLPWCLYMTPNLINVDSPSLIINAVQGDLVVILNHIVVCISRDPVKAAAHGIVWVIILAVIDDGIFNQFF